jgi:hypothetical protein
MAGTKSSSMRIDFCDWHDAKEPFNIANSLPTQSEWYIGGVIGDAHCQIGAMSIDVRQEFHI